MLRTTFHLFWPVKGDLRPLPLDPGLYSPIIRVSDDNLDDLLGGTSEQKAGTVASLHPEDYRGVPRHSYEMLAERPVIGSCQLQGLFYKTLVIWLQKGTLRVVYDRG